MPWKFKNKNFVDYYSKEEGNLEARITKMSDFNKVSIHKDNELVTSKKLAANNSLEFLFETGEKMLTEAK
ncbi:hypothetical protein [Carnobacterium sp.]|uniref:hypothetical protein n=1 Tax=Carnobacterium sp. TaxID=48221 RepID=UPI00388FF14A